MRKTRRRPSPATVMAALALFVALGGSAYATHTHRMGTQDLRNLAVTTPKLANGSVAPIKLHSNAFTALSDARLLDPRDNDDVAGTVGELSWARGPITIEDTPAGPDPIPTEDDGRFWREIDLDPGVYVLQGTAAVTAGPGDAAITRTFLDGEPITDGDGYFLVPGADGAAFSGSTVVEVDGEEQQTLVQRVVNDGSDVDYADNFLITKTQRTQ